MVAAKNVVKVENDLLDKLISKLDEIARDVSSYEYGLPMYDEGALARQREAINDWVAEVLVAQHSMKADGFSAEQIAQIRRIARDVMSAGGE